MILTLLARRHISHILISSYPTPYLSTFTCNDSSNADQHLTHLHRLPLNFFFLIFSAETKHHTSVHPVVGCCVKPWFEAFVSARGTGKDGDKEKIYRTWAITPPPSTECQNSRNPSHHQSSYPTKGWTGNSQLSLALFTFIHLRVCKARAAGTLLNISQIPAKQKRCIRNGFRRD